MARNGIVRRCIVPGAGPKLDPFQAGGNDADYPDNHCSHYGFRRTGTGRQHLCEDDRPGSKRDRTVAPSLAIVEDARDSSRRRNAQAAAQLTRWRGAIGPDRLEGYAMKWHACRFRCGGDLFQRAQWCSGADYNNSPTPPLTRTFDPPSLQRSRNCIMSCNSQSANCQTRCVSPTPRVPAPTLIRPPF